MFADDISYYVENSKDSTKKPVITNKQIQQNCTVDPRTTQVFELCGSTYISISE